MREKSSWRPGWSVSVCESTNGHCARSRGSPVGRRAAPRAPRRPFRVLRTAADEVHVTERGGVRTARAIAVWVVATTALALVAPPVPAHAGVGASWTLRHRLPQVTQHAGGAV